MGIVQAVVTFSPMNSLEHGNSIVPFLLINNSREFVSHYQFTIVRHWCTVNLLAVDKIYVGLVKDATLTTILCLLTSRMFVIAQIDPQKIPAHIDPLDVLFCTRVYKTR